MHNENELYGRPTAANSDEWRALNEDGWGRAVIGPKLYNAR